MTSRISDPSGANDAPRGTLAESVERRLLDYIRRQRLLPGAPLPKEEELSERLGISRHIVREGLSRLKALGLVEARKKRGSLLRAPDLFAGLLKVADAGLLSESDSRDLREIRAALELGMCDSIYARRTPEAVAALRAAISEAEKKPDGAYEVEFHSLLLAIAGNHIASSFRQVLLVIFPPRKQQIHWSVEESSRRHRHLCDVLENGSAEEFRAAMREHLEPGFRR